jgi:hypothetical protein
MDAATPALLGDLRERADGGYDGWCFAPGREGERLIVELLINDTVATAAVAALFRGDLLALGRGDGRHGFSMWLPPNLPGAQGECLVTARERLSRCVFGRLLRRFPARVPGAPDRLAKLATAAAALRAATDAAAAALNAAPPLTLRLRAELGALATTLATRADSAAALRSRDAGPLHVPFVAAPRLTLVLCAGAAADTRACIAALAPALGDAAADLLLLDPADDPRLALLAARVRNLGYVRDVAAAEPAAALDLAAAYGRGEILVLLGARPPCPSAAALLALAHALSNPAPAVAVGTAARALARSVGLPSLGPTVTLPAVLGVLFACTRTAWRQIGTVAAPIAGEAAACLDLALRARLLGLPVVEFAEPLPAECRDVAAPAALPASLTARWGFRAA